MYDLTAHYLVWLDSFVQIDDGIIVYITTTGEHKQYKKQAQMDQQPDGQAKFDLLSLLPGYFITSSPMHSRSQSICLT